MNEKPNNIQVEVVARFIPEQSSINDDVYYFSYDVQIINRGLEPAKLISRHWFIMDGHGQVDEVQGVGVVGEQPYLKPGESFEYTSFVRIKTPVGSMYGNYEFLADDGTIFFAEIKPFRLAMPELIH